MRVRRLASNPIVHWSMSPSLGGNVNGPSLVRAPSWVAEPLGRYYLYFAHHKGPFIRLAYADRLAGPWSIHEPGTLRLEWSHCHDHIASPDVHVDEGRREVRMYYHGRVADGVQRTKVAVSGDGIDFEASEESLGLSYFRVFRRQGFHYAIGMPGVLYRSRDGLTGFEEGPKLFGDNMRHSAVDVVGDELRVFYTNAGDSPERILLATVDMDGHWQAWKASEPAVVLEPETDYEGADLRVEPSSRGIVTERVRQLRDPAIFREGGETYLLYAVAGEQGIAIAQVEE